MGLYLVLASRDLRAAVSSTCCPFYMPFDRLAVVSYEGSAAELARRLDLDRTGGSGAAGLPSVGAVPVRRLAGLAARLMGAVLCFGVLT